MTLSTVILLSVFFLLMQGFFSGSEIAMVSIEKSVLRHQAAQGSRGAKHALSMLNRPDWMLSTTLAGTNIATVTNTTIVTAYAINRFGEQGGLYAVIIMIPLVLLFGEIIPKSVFQQRANQLVPKIVYVLWLFSFILAPIIYVFSRVSRLVSGNNADDSSPFIQRQEFISMLSTPDVVNGDIEEIEKDMIQRVFNYSETTAELAMTPLENVAAIAFDSTVEEALAFAQNCGHIRLPMYKDEHDNMVGIVNTLQMLGAPPTDVANTFMTPLHTVKHGESVATLFSDLRRSKSQVSVVLGEHGRAIGLISVEDIMEEVVADIEDEHDNTDGMVTQLGARNYRVNAHIAPQQLNEALGLKIDTQRYASLAGLLLSKFEQIPVDGDSVEIGKVCFTVSRASPRAIVEVQVTW